MLVTEDIGEGQHVTGDLGKIVDFDKDGDPEIFFDAWNKTFNKYRVVLKKMKVISGAEASRLRKNSFHVGCAVVLTEDTTDGKHMKGNTGKIVGFDEDGDPEIFFDAWNKTFKKYRVILKKLRAVTMMEEEEKRKRGACA